MSGADDARRYRWLKSKAALSYRDGGWTSHFEFPHVQAHNDSPNPAYAMKRRTLDEAIDSQAETEVKHGG